MELVCELAIIITMATALSVFHLLGEVKKELVRAARPNCKPNWKHPPLKRDGYKRPKSCSVKCPRQSAKSWENLQVT